MKLFKNYILFSLLLIVLFSSCSNNDVRVIDNESLLTKEEINFINCLDINRYNYLVFISNEYTPEKDYTAMSNEYIKLHNRNCQNSKFKNNAIMVRKYSRHYLC